MLRKLAFTTVLSRVWTLSLAMGLYAVVVLVNEQVGFGHWINLPGGLEAALTFALGMLLAFRVNRSYERWWEARTLWGSLVNVSRNLAVKVRELVRPDDAESGEIRRLIVGFPYALRDHLRDVDSLRGVPGFADASAEPQHVPNYLVGEIYRLFDHWRRSERIEPEVLFVLDREARVLLDVCGGCEKIKFTLMSPSWQTFVSQCLAVYLAALPWGLVDTFGYWTIPLTVFATYVGVALEAIAEYVEEPFGDNEDHLNLDAICATIDRSVSEIFDMAAGTEDRPGGRAVASARS